MASALVRDANNTGGTKDVAANTSQGEQNNVPWLPFFFSSFETFFSTAFIKGSMITLIIQTKSEIKSEDEL